MRIFTYAHSFVYSIHFPYIFFYIYAYIYKYDNCINAIIIKYVLSMQYKQCYSPVKLV